MILHTDRLRLEPLCPDHADGLQRLSSDPLVMRYLGSTESPEELVESIPQAQLRWARLGFSWWAFIERASGEVVGAGCIQHIENDESQPLEIGWRLRSDRWGPGLASEAARAMAAFAFETLGIAEVHAVAHPQNVASIRVMERLGMVSLGQQPHYGHLCATYVLRPPSA